MTLEQLAQRAAERRLAAANDALWLDDEGIDTGEWPDLAGPYDGCDTCLVREVLHAAWPYMYRLAHDPDTEVPDLPEDGWDA